MKSLLYKELWIMKRNWLAYLILLGLCCVPMDNDWYITPHTICVASSVLLSGIVEQDFQQGWHRQLAVLPYSSRAIVGVRYLFFWGVSLLLGLAYGLIQGVVSPGVSSSDQLACGAVLAAALLGMPVCFFPWSFYLGPGLQINAYAAAAGCYALGYLVLWRLTLLLPAGTLASSLLPLALVLVGCPFSYRLALGRYDKRTW